MRIRISIKRNKLEVNNTNWLKKVSNIAQVGGIELSTLADGAGRGTRIAWINTGSGLRFKVVIDRAMDIADAFYNAHSLSWISQLGVTAAQPFADKGADWLRTFGGGLLVTCGLTHAGGPEEDAYGQRGLHDRISNIPAEIIAIQQPDPAQGIMDMRITGVIRQGNPLGQILELKRTIRAVLGESKIYIDDEVLNRSNFPVPHMLLYHFNFGWPLVDAGADLLWDGKWYAREQGEANKIFKAGQDFKKCLAPIADHNGNGEEAAFIDVDSDSNGHCQCGIRNEKIGLEVALDFNKAQLPWLTNWQHWGEGEYVTGLEPGTNPPYGQKKCREQGELIMLAPAARKNYNIVFSVAELNR